MDLVQKINSLRAHPPSYWVNAANQHLPDMLSVVFVILIAWYLTKLIWVLVPPASNFDWTAKRASQANTGLQVSTASSSTFRTITSAHLFGEAGKESIVATTIDAPETRLNLKLRATIAAPDDSLAHAIIADGKGTDDVYFIGETVVGGAKLHEVHPDRVILNRSGTLETLRLPKLSESLGKQQVRRTSASPARPTASASGSLQQAMQQDASSFTDILRPQPYMPNGELKGYRVYPGRDRRKFAALGLRPGDLVTEMNGQSLTDLQSGMDVFRQLGDSPQISVTLERNGNPMVLTLDTNQVLNSEGAQK